MKPPSPAGIERRVLGLLERLAPRPGDLEYRARLLRNEPAEVLARLAHLEKLSGAGGAMPTQMPGVFDTLSFERPKRFGPFRITQQLGVGGMGEVWRGERDDGLYDQTVAIKLIHGHLQTAAGAAFENERRILATLEHPNIARLIDGGATADGRACLVMEFVDGVGIDQACAALPLERRLALFAQTAEAVQFAHSRLVAHGDLKPGNVLVDGQGRVRLLDFGIARLVGDESSTNQVTGAMSADYASPQRRQGAAPSIADDVFALGRLLSGITGNDGDEDLRAIIAKACAGLEADRYGNVHVLIADLERRTAHRPLRAVPSTWTYIAGKYVRRNWRVIAAASILALTSAVATWGYVRAEQERIEASARFDDARGTARYLLFGLFDRLENEPNSIALRREVAGVAQHYLDRLAHSRSTGPGVRLEAAQGLLRLAEVQGSPTVANLGQVGAAGRNYQTAIALLQGMTGRDAQRVAAQAHLDAAMLSELVEDNEAHAAAHLDAAKALMDRDPETPAIMRAEYLTSLSYVEQWRGHYPRALALATEAEAALPKDEALTTLVFAARAAELSGDATFYAGDGAAAVPFYRRSVAALQNAAARYPQSRFVLKRLGHARWALGTVLADFGHPAEGLLVLEQSTRDMHAAVAFDADDDDAKRQLLVSQDGLAGALVQSGQVAQGLALKAQTVANRKALWRSRPTEHRRFRDYIVALKTLADLRAENKQTLQACADYAETRALFEHMRAQGRLTEQDRTNQLGEVIKSQTRLCQSG